MNQHEGDRRNRSSESEHERWIMMKMENKISRTQNLDLITQIGDMQERLVDVQDKMDKQAKQMDELLGIMFKTYINEENQQQKLPPLI